MKNLKVLHLLPVIALLFLSGCGDSKSTSEVEGQRPIEPNCFSGCRPDKIDWGSIPSDFNPQIATYILNTDDIEQIKMNLFGSNEDVQVSYSKDVRPNESWLSLFSVSKDAASMSDVKSKANGSILELSQNGRYECSIKISNRQITSLKGLCYVKLHVVLPIDAQIEVYNLNKLITRRFISITTEAFLKNFDNASWPEDKFKTIEDYLSSHSGTDNRPKMYVKQLSVVIHDFSSSEDKKRALKMLHAFVIDREKLGAMIDSEFGYFEREEARKIAGL